MLMVFMLALAALLGFTAMSIDVGLAYHDRRLAQNGADAAALAGGDILLEGGTQAQAKATAERWAARNGYQPSQVTVNVPPASGPYAGNADHVEVIITDVTQAAFANVLGINFWDISARAVAGISRTKAPYAIVVLNRTACNAFEIDGEITIDIQGAGMVTNSSCSTSALYAEGGVKVNSAINDVVGGTSTSGPVTLSPPPSRVGQIDDPLASLPPPTPPSGPVWPCPTFSGAVPTVTLLPGVYNCPIDPAGSQSLVTLPGDYLFNGGFVNDGNGGATTFGAGIYTVRGQGWISTGSGNINGDGVMFYIDTGGLRMTGTGDVSLTPPTSGPYKGIVFFQNRANTNTVYIGGQAIGSGFGTIYAVKAKIDFTGTAVVTSGYQMISDTFYAHGTANLTIDYVAGVEPIVPRMKLFE
jgi:hypothetical protein